MSKNPRDNRIPIMMSDDELKAIDDWSFSNRVRTRADSIRRLCQLGTAFEEKRYDLSKNCRELEAKVFQLKEATSKIAAQDNISEADQEVLQSTADLFMAFIGMRDVVIDLLLEHANFVNDEKLPDEIVNNAQAKDFFAQTSKEFQELVKAASAKKP